MNSTSSKTILTKVPTNLPPEREYILTVWVWKMLLERERFPRDISILLFFIMFASSTSMSKTTMAGFFSSLLTVLSPTCVHILEKNSSVLVHILGPWTVNVNARSTFNRIIRAVHCRSGRPLITKQHMANQHDCNQLIGMLRRHTWAQPPNIGNMQCKSATDALNNIHAQSGPMIHPCFISMLWYI